MSNNEEASLAGLPQELVYHLFTYLDAQTIIRSLRCLCKRFYILVNRYNQFHFNLKSIFKSDFHLLCNYISPKNVQSLILSDNDQTAGEIEYFLSILRLNSFTQLRYLILDEIDDYHLSMILKDIPKCLIQSLTIQSKRDYSQNNTISDDLFAILSLLTLRKLNFNISTFNLSTIIWPVECRLQNLQINCQTFDQYCLIVSHLPNLKVLVIRELDGQIPDGILPQISDIEPFHQLISLTFQSCHIDVIILDLLLSLSPTIEHLQLMRSVDLDVFLAHLPSWEKFIQSKLLLLNKLELFLVDNRQLFVDHSSNGESIVSLFRTRFWTEIKQWFIICDYIKSPRTVILYTLSFFDSQFEYIYQSKQISRSTSLSTIMNNTIIMDEIKKIRLDLRDVMPLATSTQGGLPINAVFPKITDLTINIGIQWPLGSLRFLSTLIDLSQVITLSLEMDNSFNLYSESTINIDKLMKLMKNIQSLKIFISSGFMSISDHHMDICSLIPHHLKHLTISVSTVKQMKRVLAQRRSLSSIKFEYTNAYYHASDMHIGLLETERQDYTYRLNNSSLCMWFDNHLKTLKKK